MKGEIIAEIQTVEPDSNVGQIVHGQVTKCNSYLHDCRNFRYETHILKKGPDKKIIPGQVQIGLCGLTEVACLQVAKIIALGLAPSDTQPNKT